MRELENIIKERVSDKFKIQYGGDGEYIFLPKKRKSRYSLSEEMKELIEIFSDFTMNKEPEESVLFVRVEISPIPDTDCMRFYFKE